MSAPLPWERMSHAEIHALAHAGPGPGASTQAEDLWRRVAEIVTAGEAAMDRAVRRSEGMWEGSAGDGARTGLHELNAWARDAATDAANTTAAMVDQGMHAGHLRSTVPEPYTAEYAAAERFANENPFDEGMQRAFLGAQDERALRDEDARQKMATYHYDSVRNRDLMDIWTTPPTVVVEAAAASGSAGVGAGGTAGGTGVGTAVGGGEAGGGVGGGIGGSAIASGVAGGAVGGGAVGGGAVGGGAVGGGAAAGGGAGGGGPAADGTGSPIGGGGVVGGGTASSTAGDRGGAGGRAGDPTVSAGGAVPAAGSPVAAGATGSGPARVGSTGAPAGPTGVSGPSAVSGAAPVTAPDRRSAPPLPTGRDSLPPGAGGRGPRSTVPPGGAPQGGDGVRAVAPRAPVPPAPAPTWRDLVAANRVPERVAGEFGARPGPDGGRPGSGPTNPGPAPNGPTPRADGLRAAGATGSSGPSSGPGMYPPTAAGAPGAAGGTRRRAPYLLDDTGVFDVEDQLHFTDPVIRGTDQERRPG